MAGVFARMSVCASVCFECLSVNVMSIYLFQCVSVMCLCESAYVYVCAYVFLPVCVCLSVSMFARWGVASMCVGFPGIDVRPFFMLKWILEPATEDAKVVEKISSVEKEEDLRRREMDHLDFKQFHQQPLRLRRLQRVVNSRGWKTDYKSDSL